MKAKTITAYCIKEPDRKFKGSIKLDTISFNRKSCIDNFCDSIFRWVNLKKIGWKCVKVKITEVKPK